MGSVFPQVSGQTCQWATVTLRSSLLGWELGETGWSSLPSAPTGSPGHKRLHWDTSLGAGACRVLLRDAPWGPLMRGVGFPRQTTGADLVVKTVPVPDTGDSVVSGALAPRELSAAAAGPRVPASLHHHPPPYRRCSARTGPGLA